METLYYLSSETQKCRVCFHHATMGNSNQKIGKPIILVFEKVFQLVAKSLGTLKTKKKLLKVKPLPWII